MRFILFSYHTIVLKLSEKITRILNYLGLIKYNIYFIENTHQERLKFSAAAKILIYLRLSVNSKPTFRN